jgi:hypothetical protein
MDFTKILKAEKYARSTRLLSSSPHRSHTDLKGVEQDANQRYEDVPDDSTAISIRER